MQNPEQGRVSCEQSVTLNARRAEGRNGDMRRYAG